MKQKKSFSLIENARSSLQHAVEHLTKIEVANNYDIKFAIRDVTHVVELLIKEYLQRIHPSLIWQDVDKYPSLEANIVSLGKAAKRIVNIGEIRLSDESQKTIQTCKKIRDKIEHFECTFDQKEAKVVIGRMLAFIFDFSKKYLNLELESDFRADDTWDSLISMYEFWSAQKDIIEKRMKEQGICVYICPMCGADTFDVNEKECNLCGHKEDFVECDICHEEYFESETEIEREVDYDEEGVSFAREFRICENCREKASMNID